MNVILVSALLYTVIVTADAWQAGPLSRQLLRSLHERRSEEDCVGIGGGCRSSLGYRRCCGTTVCAWEDGVSFIQDGKCVDCIADSSACQKDDTCCGGSVCHRTSVALDGVCGPRNGDGGPCTKDNKCSAGLVCHRESKTDYNGVCGRLRSVGEKCHENDNCSEGLECDLEMSSFWMSGLCAVE